MDRAFLENLKKQTADLVSAGLFKEEREIASPQSSRITLADGREVINLCANNYLGLADSQSLIEAAKHSFAKYGFGTASVRFICGTQTLHRQLENKLSQFLGTDETILYSSCFDANGGLFETVLGAEDAVISDELNHASIIDGIRLCKAQRLRYKNNDMADLEARLQEAKGARYRLIATDGVFSMDGTIANLKAICDLADRYQALVMVDDCHATGFIGKSGKGTPEHCGVMGRVDILTGTLGKALGGASGGYTSGRKEIIDWLRQRSRPYLFSNSLMPAIAAASLEVIHLLEKGDALRQRLKDNGLYFRERMSALGFNLVPGSHPIIPIMLGEATLAQEMAKRLLQHGIYVIGFSYPVVSHGKARIRTQMSAAHTKQDLDRAIEAFATVGQELGILSNKN